MRYCVLVFGWLLLGMGLVLGVLSMLALVGLLPLQIDFFGIAIDEPGERTLWSIAWLAVAAIGLVMLVAVRSRGAAPNEEAEGQTGDAGLFG